MSRGAAARRRRTDAESWLAVCGPGECTDNNDNDNDNEIDNDRSRQEIEGLRGKVAEVEGWYRLLQEDHLALQKSHDRTGRRAVELQAEVNRLEAENHELGAWLSRLGAAGEAPREHHGDSKMNRFASFVREVRNHRWTAAAVMAIVTLLARDAAVQGLAARAVDRARQAVGAGNDPARDPATSGFLRYAAMINSRDQLERTRRLYNEGEASLKGDALLEAQDSLRAAKARYREARLAFLPELARQCERARVALPAEAAEALAALDRGARE